MILYRKNQTHRIREGGFTLVEMLIAMAITLIMMAGLARTFALVGDKVRNSRANVQLSNDLRDITTRLNDELSRCTASLAVNEGGHDQAGYFMFYEGPVTNVTSSIFRAKNDPDGNLLPDSRYGDFDDYLAFTAVAPPNTWFTGKVPRYLLERKSAEVSGFTATPDPFEPVMIKSRYAEIIYFASPEYDGSIATSNSLYPKYVDVDGDSDLDGDAVENENGLPDRMFLHRRILLIRPDLNLETIPNIGLLPTQSNGTVTFMQADAYPTNWQVAMAAAHQQCDLSLRRGLLANGLPSTRIAANSLEDLSVPHNRFAHVRIPNSELFGSGGANSPTSMPILALSPPATVLSMENDSGIRIGPDESPVAGSVVTPKDWSGFLRPEFVLGGDRIHTDPGGLWWSLKARRGEDVLINNALAFDVKVFDANASWIQDPGSNLIIGPSDPGYRDLLNSSTTLTTMSGGYVDLGYPTLAGGSLRGWVQRLVDLRTTSATLDSAAIPAANGSHLISQFSGVRNMTASPVTAYRYSLYRSGNLITDSSNRIRLYQPTFDTYTSHYEHDGFLQDDPIVAPLGTGTVWMDVTAAGADLGADGLDTDGTLGADDSEERETLPPFDIRPEAVRISIRLENPRSRQMKQASVVHRDGR